MIYQRMVLGVSCILRFLAGLRQEDACSQVRTSTLPHFGHEQSFADVTS